MFDSRKAVEEIRDLPEPPQVYVVCTGAGAGLQKLLWDVPGCSRFLVGAAFPYAARDTADFLGFDPEKACDPKTAVQLALEAYQRAWAPGNTKTIGVGMTAVVATSREHKGDHRLYIATVSEDDCFVYEIVLFKGRGARQEEGELCGLLTLDALRVAAGLPGPSGRFKHQHLRDDRLIKSWAFRTNAASYVRDVFLERPFTNATPGRAGPRFDLYVHFPGAFNPPHEGHFEIADAIEDRFDRKVLFTIEADPPHKPGLSVTDMIQRAKMLKGRNVLFTSGKALYADKAKAYNCDFVLGADALLRMLTWCGASDADILREMQPFLAQHTMFFVVGREIPGRGYTTLQDLVESGAIPEVAMHCFESVGGRWDISSTQIRESA